MTAVIELSRTVQDFYSFDDKIPLEYFPFPKFDKEGKITGLEI